MKVIFPMGGKAERFGGTFKPLLLLNGKSFIELAASTFASLGDLVDSIYGICTASQRADYMLYKNERFNSLFDEIFYINEYTTGPLETIRAAMMLYPETLICSNGTKPVVFCDCDHYLDITGFSLELFEDSDVVLPVINLSPLERSADWLVARIKAEGSIEFIEKPEYINFVEKSYGVIGCYFFRTESLFNELINNTIGKSLSDIFKSHSDLRYKLLTIQNATFFGDPRRLQSAIKSGCNLRRSTD